MFADNRNEHKETYFYVSVCMFTLQCQQGELQRLRRWQRLLGYRYSQT
jgi:hypothetical protein